MGRFALVGLSGVGVNLGALYLITTAFGLHRWAAAPLAIELSILSNFLLNNAWTFKDRNAAAAAGLGGRFFRYNLVSLLGMGIQLLVFESICQMVMAVGGRAEPGPFIYPAQLIGIVVATGWNFVSNMRWTWAQAPTMSHEKAH